MVRYAKGLTTTSLLLSALLSAGAMAQSTGLEDLVGARGGQAEGELQRRGYVFADGQKGDDRSYANWWNADRRQCVTIATMNGRYDSITPTTAPDCNKPASVQPRRDRRYPDDRARSGNDGAAMGNGTADLSRYCKGEAAARFDRRPGDITTNLPIRQRDGATVSGWFENGARTKFFTCRFDAGGRLISVN